MTNAISRVPPEVLGKIFLYTLGDSDTLALPPQRSQCPWKLRSICSTWRQVALQEPQLWSNISLSLSPSHLLIASHPPDYSYVREIIPSHVPLSITLKGDYPIDDNVLEELVLSRLDWQITKLHFNVLIPPESIFWTVPPESFSYIEDFSFIFPKFYDVDGRQAGGVLSLPSTDIHIFEHARHLKKFRMETGDYEDGEPNDNLLFGISGIPWSQLTHIDLFDASDIHADTLHRVLIQCHSLEIFAANISTNRFRRPTIREGVISLPYLTSIHLREGLGRDESLLDDNLSLDLPWAQLKTLKLEGSDRDYESALTIFSSALHLEKLDFAIELSNHFDWTSREISFQFLHTLSLADMNMPLLSVSVAPRLEELSIYHVPESWSEYSYLPFPPEQVMGFLQRSGCSLKVFKYDTSETLKGRDNIEEFIVSLNSLREWTAPTVCLSDRVIKAIGEGVLLPELRVFHTMVQWSSVFADAMENRVKKLGSPLRKGSTRFVSHRDGTRKVANRQPDTNDATMKRLRRLNRSFGTRFTIVTET